MRKRKPLTIGSLFSGIAGLERGLELAGHGPVKYQVEINEFCLRILERHYPDTVRFTDVRKVGKKQLCKVDILCGGYPCQGMSSAGKRKGFKDARSGLWREFRRIIRETKPKYVVVENVASGAKKWLCKVRSDLHALGYRTRALGISAADVGAPHLRRRIFVVAYPKRLAVRIERRWRSGSWQGAENQAFAGVDGGEGHVAYANGSARGAWFGNGASQELSGGHGSDGGREHDHRLFAATKIILEARAEGRQLTSEEIVAHAYCAGLAVRRIELARQERATPQRGRTNQRKGSPQPLLGRDAPRLPFGLDRWPARPGEPQKAWEPPRVATGVAEREAKLTALGNAVLPACSYVVGVIIDEIDEATR